MCGGRGSRLGSEVEKPLFEVAGQHMLDRVRAALAKSRIETVYAVVSPQTPETRTHLDDLEAPTIDTPGEGYVADLGHALDHVSLPVLTVTTDLPLLDGTAVDRVLDSHDRTCRRRESLSVYVPAAVKQLLGASADRTVTESGRTVTPAGINIVSSGETERSHVTWDVRLAVNVNYPEDATIAEVLA
jgi:adenosylcobinamide-phosphate guanylyltransferase